MKKIRFAVLSVLLAASMLMTGCSSGSDGNAEAAGDGSSSTQIVIDGNDMPDDSGEEMTTRPLEEGDILAIHKINPKTTGDVFAGGYKLVDEDEASQGKMYMNGGSRVIIRAQNYKEDMQSLEIWADNACLMISFANVTAACDTVFGDPQKTTVCGYDAIMYDYDVLQYEFLDDGSKNQTDTFKGRNYYFYSDKDAYVLMFDTNDETYEEQLKCFEEFVADLEIANVEY
ncbi:MAG: hypothetical protein IJZ61_02480 [Oscillospiraceae bacterium]|nr:hypothetical protein [Oscillospiraceae bacterium]